MLRASSGKHARLVGVCPAGGDSVPADPADAADPGIVFFLRFVHPPCPKKRPDTKRSALYIWTLVLGAEISQFYPPDIKRTCAPVWDMTRT